MKNVKVFICLFVLLSGIDHALCETMITSLEDKIIPPSPTSAKFHTYTGAQPSLATGAINISIPCYEINCFGVQIPLTLSYHTNGIKVEDSPYPCGYGWNFTSGFRISRTIMGRPDEQYKTDIRQTDYSFEYRKKIAKEDIYGVADTTLIDTQNDIFTASLIGENISFILQKKDNKFIPLTIGNNIKIETDNKLSYFKCTDQNGIIYEFIGPKESMGHDRFVTAWMLSSILLPNNTRINFHWAKLYSPHSTMQYTPKAWKDLFYSPAHPGFNDGNMNFYEPNFCTQLLNYNEACFLSSIDFPGGNIQIHYKKDPETAQYENIPLFTQILVYNINNQLIKQIDFTYGIKGNADEHLLKALHISDEGSYNFEYHETEFNPNIETAQDFWGYYNGKTSNLDLFPYIELKSQPLQLNPNSTKIIMHGKADRNIDAVAMQANMLKKITYPTGGFSIYEYEPHVFKGKDVDKSLILNNSTLSVGGGLRVKRIITQAENNSAPIESRYEYSTGISYGEPTLDTFIETNFSTGLEPRTSDGIFAYSYRQIRFNSQSNFQKYHFNEIPIWYETVTEYQNQGKTEYEFYSNFKNDVVNSPSETYVRKIRTLFSNQPILNEKRIYKQENGKYILIQKEEYHYRQNWKDQIHNLQILRPWLNNLQYRDKGAPDFSFSHDGGIYYDKMPDLIDTYYFPLEQESLYTSIPQILYLCNYELAQIVSTKYHNDKNLTTSTTFDWTNSLLREKVTTVNNSVKAVESYWYPFDSLSVPIYKQMTECNIINNPIKIETIKNESKSTTIKEFKNIGNMYLPTKETTTQGVGTGSKIEYDYDNFGNIRSTTFNDKISETFLWGYRGLYPVLHIKGLKYNELTKEIGQSNIDMSALSSSELTTKCTDIRNKLIGKALVSSFDYIPLVGTATVTDPRGLSTTYKYDNKWRLNEIVDNDGHAVSQYAYNLYSAHFGATMHIPEKMNVGRQFDVIAEPQNGSGQYSILWHNTSKELQIQETSDNTLVHITAVRPGNYILSATVKDNLSGLSTTAKTTAAIMPECISICPDGPNDKQKVTATITATNPVTLYFDCWANLHTNIEKPGNALVRIDNDYYTLTGEGEINRKFKCEIGAGKKVLSIEISPETIGAVRLTLENVTGSNNETFEKTSIQASN